MQNDLGKMRTADMNLIELMVAANRIAMAQKLTLDMNEFCQVTGKDRSTVYSLLRTRYYPEDLIVGGYEDRRRKKKLLFDTQKVLEWIRR